MDVGVWVFPPALFFFPHQDIEFTVENGRLYMLQCRNGKRTAKAAVKIAVDMVKEGKLTPTEALLRIPANQMDFFLHPTLDPDAVKVRWMPTCSLPVQPFPSAVLSRMVASVPLRPPPPCRVMSCFICHPGFLILSLVPDRVYRVQHTSRNKMFF